MMGNSVRSWGWLARLFHWVGAAAIFVLLGHGWWMTHMVERAERASNYAWHAALGYDFLALLILRQLWRWVNVRPELPRDMPAWEKRAARISHSGIYLLMFAATLFGWALAGTFQTPYTSDFLGAAFPRLITDTERSTHELFENGHLILAYILAAFVIVHIIAAIRHQFAKHDDVLARMTFGR